MRASDTPIQCLLLTIYRQLLVNTYLLGLPFKRLKTQTLCLDGRCIGSFLELNSSFCNSSLLYEAIRKKQVRKPKTVTRIKELLLEEKILENRKGFGGMTVSAEL